MRRLVSSTLKAGMRHRTVIVSRRSQQQYSLWRRCIAATLNVTLPASRVAYRNLEPEPKLRELKSRRNILKGITLTAVLLGIVGLIASSLGRSGMLIVLAVAIAAMGFAYRNSDRLALQAMRARPAGESEVPQVYRVVRELSVAARRPAPSIYLSPTGAPNAFAVGRTRGSSALCCTEGLLRLLDERELRGVIAHELGHIHNRDVLISSTVGALAGGVVSLLNLVWMTPLGRSDEEGGSVLLGALTTVLLGGPIAAALIRLAVSRSCEFRADAVGASLTGDPMALASALRKLDLGVNMLPLPPEPRLQVRGHMMIVSPFRARNFMSRLLSTHAPTQERIARLEHMVDRHARP
ncbi:M48 family metalloprotease [Streptomyces tendae]|uniref:M48 family metalloprotease n=1 Tax=Streptomyces tendae TaxID=1932 RepID=UPI0036A73031